MALHLSERPKEVVELKGNKHAKATMETLLAKPVSERPHTYLFSGPRGCGKTTSARIMAMKFGAVRESIIEINCANKNGVENIRELEKTIKLAPLFGEAKCYIWDECHELTGRAQNSALKMLEDAPSHVYFFLCTTEPKKLKSTIRSRCTRITLTTIDDRDMSRLLKGTAAKLGKVLSNDVIDLIISNAAGHPREAMVALDTIIDLPEELQLEAVEEQKDLETQVKELCQVMGRKNTKWKGIMEVYTGLPKEGPEKIRRALLGYYRNALIRSGARKHAFIIQVCSESTFNTGDAGLVWMIWTAWKQEQEVEG